MHDTEPDTFVIQSMPEKFSEMLKEIAVDSTPKEIATDETWGSKGDGYSMYFDTEEVES